METSFNDAGNTFFNGVGKRSNVETRTFKPSIPAKHHVFRIGSLTVTIKTGDIIDEHGKLIVNTANEFLLDGSGVTGAIFAEMSGPNVPKVAQYDFQGMCDNLGYCQPGRSVLVTTPQHKYIPGVIHLVGHPMVHGREKQVRVFYMEAINDALNIAKQEKLPIVFPALGTGAYGISPLIAVDWFYRALWTHSDENAEPLDVTVDLFSVQDWHIYRSSFIDLTWEREQVQ